MGGAFATTRNVTVYRQSGQLIYGQEPDIQAVPQPPAQPSPSGYARLMTSLQALYLFHEGFGQVASDISGSGIPLDMELKGANDKWVPTGGLDLTIGNHNAILENRTPNRKLYSSSAATGQVAVEAWVEPSNLTQDNARIAEFGSPAGASDVTWAMVQKMKNLEFRLRTANGALVYLATTGNPLATANARYHVAMTYKPYNSSSGEGGMRIYVNGSLAAYNQESGAIASTGTNAWIAGHILTLGNHAVALDRDWQGKVNLFAVYSKDLALADVTRNYNAGVVEPAVNGDFRMGVACQDRVLPKDILDGYRDWREDKTADGRSLAMGGTPYAFGLGGQPQSNGSASWMAYDLLAENARLGLSNQPLRLTGFGGKQDGSGSASVFVKTSANTAQPSDNDWLNNAGGVVQRFFTSDATQTPLDLDLRHAKWLLLGTNSTQTGTNLHGVFGNLKLRYGTVAAPVFAPKLVYRYHQIDGLSQLPGFDALTPMKTGLVDRFELTPKLRADNFAFEFAGFLYIATAGTYTFYTSSDDGSRLFLDGKLVVDNDGIHASQERSGQATLAVGYHPIKVQFFENSGGELLEVKYQGPGISKKIIPLEALFHSETFDYGVDAKYYEGSWNSLPSFEAMTPVKADIRKNFLISPRALSDGFGFVFEGHIYLPADGNYTFFTNSDDGSQLFIDGKPVVNNDGVHPMQERSGSLNLTAGFHSIRVTYFDKNGGEGLEVRFQGPGFAKAAIPVELLFASGSQAPDVNPSGKAGAIVMEGQSVDRNYTMSGIQWFKIPLANYANTWAGRIFVSLDDMDLRPMVGTFKFENGTSQSIEGWYKSYVTTYTHQNELYFLLDIPERRTYKVRWWFEP